MGNAMSPQWADPISENNAPAVRALLGRGAFKLTDMVRSEREQMHVFRFRYLTIPKIQRHASGSLMRQYGFFWESP
jgi:hypothetical protein